MRVFVTNYWGDTNESFYKRLHIQRPKDFNFFELTLDIRNADFIFILDNTNLSILNKKNKNAKTVLLQREPSYLSNLNNNIINYVDKSFLYKDDNKCFVAWWLDYNYEELINLKYNDLKKDKEFICISSAKSFTQGHKTRLEWLKKIQNLLKIDFYGKPGIQNLFNNYKGTPESFSKTNNTNKNISKNILGEYHKSFSFENGAEKNFITRVNEDLLMWTLPLYWGCPNIDEIYPNNSYRSVDISKNIDNEIIEYFKAPLSKDELLAIEDARLLILNKYNFWFYIKNIIYNF